MLRFAKVGNSQGKLYCMGNDLWSVHRRYGIFTLYCKMHGTVTFGQMVPAF